jgi:hypothetical protein
MDFFCLTPIGIRVAYPSQAVLRPLSKRARARLRGRAVLALTADRYYALRGVHPGARLAPVAKRLKVKRGMTIGKNTWYVVPAGSSRGVLKVKHGVIEEVGIANKSLTTNRAASRRLLANLT